MENVGNVVKIIFQVGIGGNLLYGIYFIVVGSSGDFKEFFQLICICCIKFVGQVIIIDYYVIWCFIVRCEFVFWYYGYLVQVFIVMYIGYV